MKAMFTTLFTFGCVLMTTLSGFAGLQTVGGVKWHYSVEAGGASVTGVDDATAKIVIPSKLGGYPVTGIGDAAFFEHAEITSVTIPSSVTVIGGEAFAFTGLTSVTIPSSVTVVGASAFESCESLASLTISQGVKSINDYAFAYCGALSSVTIPASVVNIGGWVFAGCKSVSQFVVASGNPSFCSKNAMLCSSDGKRLIAGVNGAVTIPSGVVDIAEDAFHSRENLTTVSIPASVASIGAFTFDGCKKIKSFSVAAANPVFCAKNSMLCSRNGELLYEGVNGAVTIPSGVKTIMANAFDSRVSLTSVTIPSSVTTIGDFAFVECSALEAVTMQSGVTSIGRYVFNGCTALEKLTIPASVTVLGEDMFWYCDSLSRVYFPGMPPEGVCAAALDEEILLYYNAAYKAQWQSVISDGGFSNARAYTPGASTYTIRFKSGGGATGTMVNLSCKPNTVYQLPDCGFVSSGEKTFAGWACMETGKRYDPGIMIVNLGEAGEDITFTALWK